jgi:hypothetical protein
MSKITISNNILIEEISFKWNNGYVNLILIIFIVENIIRDTEVELELIQQLYSPTNDESDGKNAKIIESNASPVVECIIRELFRIYEPFCYQRTYGRGAGYPLNACPTDSPDKSGLLCYPKCLDGYVGVGPVCWEDCGNMTAVGIFCVGSNAAESSYDDNNKSQVVKRLCSSCSNTSYKRIFIRKSYGRGFGVPMICSSQYEQNGALCYDYCDKKYYGIGPVCWQYCPLSQPVYCLGIGCTITSIDCAKVIIEMVAVVTAVAMNIIRLKIVNSFINEITANLTDSATKSDWKSVSGNMSILSNTFADTILTDVSKNCNDWPLDVLQSATKNASLLLAVTAYNDINILSPFLKLFDISGIIKAFDHALCNLRDDFLN